MNTFAIQLVLHYQNASPEDTRFAGFLQELKAVAERHGVSFDDYQSVRLSGEDYRIRPCAHCGHLTVDRDDVRDGIENMLPDFWFYVRRGQAMDNTAVCEFCQYSKNAT